MSESEQTKRLYRKAFPSKPDVYVEPYWGEQLELSRRLDALEAAKGKTESPTMTTRTPISVLIAIRARIHGEFDNPHLMQMGVLSTDTLADIGAWCARAIKEADYWPAEKLKTNPASKAGWVDGPRYRRGDRVWASSDVDQWGRISAEGRVEEVYDDAILVRLGGQIRANVMIPIGDCNALPFDVHSLKEGDEVYWNDPDNGKCSRYFTIQKIELRDDGEGTVRITDKDGSELECFAGELA